MMWQQAVGNREDVQCCAQCGCSNTSFPFSMSAIGVGKEEELADLGDSVPKEEIVCTLGCGIRYCSGNCRGQDFENGHGMICMALAPGEDHPLYQFRIEAFESGFYDEICLAQRICAKEVSSGEKILQTSSQWTAFQQNATGTVERTFDLLKDSGVVAPFLTLKHWNSIIGFVIQRRIEVSSFDLPLVHHLNSLLIPFLDGKLDQPSKDLIEEVFEARKQFIDGGIAASELCLLVDCRNFLPPKEGIAVSLSSSFSNMKHSCLAEVVKITFNPALSMECNDEASFFDPCNRDSELGERGIHCVCLVCLHERAPRHEFSFEELEKLVRAAENDGRFSDAICLIDSLLAIAPEETSLVLTKKKIRLLGWDDRWKEAVEIENTFLHAEEQSCFHFPSFSFPTVPGPDLRFLDSRIWMTENIFSSEECDFIVDAAEQFAASHGGWTTKRHFSVPTTDMPVVLIEGIQDVFKSKLREKVYPLLAAQFTIDPKSIVAIDMFIVKFEALKQNFLPLHSDQSQFSFTIALNNEFRGGGTFFASLGESLNPPKGGMVSFPGELLHGGLQITEGCRFIAAGFLFEH